MMRKTVGYGFWLLCTGAHCWNNGGKVEPPTPLSDPAPEFIDHLLKEYRSVDERLRFEARRASIVLPPPNPLLAATLDGEPPVPLA
jgi:hypothetical protein